MLKISKMKMSNKKAAEGMMWTVIVIALLLFFLLIYSGVWNRLFGKGTSSLKEQFSSAGDSDNDGVINAADKCPCPGGEGTLENDGCPAGYKITGTNTDKESRACLSKIT